MLNYYRLNFLTLNDLIGPECEFYPYFDSYLWTIFGPGIALIGYIVIVLVAILSFIFGTVAHANPDNLPNTNTSSSSSSSSATSSSASTSSSSSTSNSLALERARSAMMSSPFTINPASFRNIPPQTMNRPLLIGPTQATTTTPNQAQPTSNWSGERDYLHLICGASGAIGGAYERYRAFQEKYPALHGATWSQSFLAKNPHAKFFSPVIANGGLRSIAGGLLVGVLQLVILVQELANRNEVNFKYYMIYIFTT